jgi:site-specific recombinase XerD
MSEAPCPPSNELVRVHAAPASAPIVISTYGASMSLPALIADAGERASRSTFDFFAASVENDHTREAYARAVHRFCAWCAEGGVTLHAIAPPHVAAYLKVLGEAGKSKATVKLHLAAIRNWMRWLTEHGVLHGNPASEVRGPKLVVSEGKTPALSREQARVLLDSLEGSDLMSLRDRALIGVMLFAWARVSAVCSMRVCDVEDDGGPNATLFFQEKGGKEMRKHCHRRLRELLAAYIVAAGLGAQSKEPLFQSFGGRGRGLTGKALRRTDVLAIVKKRCEAAALPSRFSNHSFRATAITLHHLGGGRLQEAQVLAGHADPRTTLVYIRRSEELDRDEVERVQV